eukprot:4091878-Amphidinium_carterae.1
MPLHYQQWVPLLGAWRQRTGISHGVLPISSPTRPSVHDVPNSFGGAPMNALTGGALFIVTLPKTPRKWRFRFQSPKHEDDGLSDSD